MHLYDKRNKLMQKNKIDKYKPQIIYFTNYTGNCTHLFAQLLNIPSSILYCLK